MKAWLEKLAAPFKAPRVAAETALAVIPAPIRCTTARICPVMEIESTGPDLREYHFRVEVSKKVTDRVAHLFGVERCTHYRYKIFVTKGCLFDWSEIHPHIMNIIEEGL